VSNEDDRIEPEPLQCSLLFDDRRSGEQRTQKGKEGFEVGVKGGEVKGILGRHVTLKERWLLL
jgi:hypothetical protein